MENLERKRREKETKNKERKRKGKREKKGRERENVVKDRERGSRGRKEADHPPPPTVADTIMCHRELPAAATAVVDIVFRR